MDWLFERPIAHRGYHDLDLAVPENSMAAFAAAVAQDYPIELDVRLLGDGEVAVFHDDTLDRLTDEDGPLDRLTAEAAAATPLCGTEETIPVLRDVLDVVAGAVGVLVEIKNEGLPGPLEEAVWATVQHYEGPLAVQSFNPFTLRWFKQNAPRIPRGQLSGDFRDAPIRRAMARRLQDLKMNRVSDPAFVGYDVRCLPADPVAQVRTQGVPVLGWTVRSAEEAARVAPFCDNIIFEGFSPDPTDGS